MMSIVSKLRDKSFLRCQLFEHAMITVLLGAGIPATLFFGIMMSSRRNSDDAVSLMETVFENDGITLMIIVGVLAVLVNLVLLHVRKMSIVVQVELDPVAKVLRIEVRGRSVASLTSVDVPFTHLGWKRYSTPSIPAMPSYHGYEILNDNEHVGYLLIDHFTWDDQPRRMRSFLVELNELVPITP